MRLHDLTWPDAAAAVEAGTPLVLPLGSLEQHGPHLPFDTDTVCVQAVADNGADGAGAIALPALSYGAPSRPRSGGGPGFPLGAEIPFGTYYDVVRGILVNLLSRGARNLLVLTWHTENAPVIYEAAREAASIARAENAKIVALDSPGSLIARETAQKAYVDGPVPGEFEHAGLIETSVMLALAPDRVREFSGVESSLPKLGYDVVPMPTEVVSPTGSFTSPRNATAEIGQLLLDDLYPNLAKLIGSEFDARRSDRNA
ncbi:MAG TPA: creatininase family protein [Solirubrobacteraceae bacterium]|nr:creatininase family protein [Solirubrobacteraceae bacterium]